MWIFPHAESCLRRVRALTVERHETWKTIAILNMDLLKEHKKEMLKAERALCFLATSREW
jgi:putative transposase